MTQIISSSHFVPFIILTFIILKIKKNYSSFTLFFIFTFQIHHYQFLKVRKKNKTFKFNYLQQIFKEKVTKLRLIRTFKY